MSKQRSLTCTGSITLVIMPVSHNTARTTIPSITTVTSSIYVSIWTPIWPLSLFLLPILSIYPFIWRIIYTWLSVIPCRLLRITDWQGFLVHWHIMTLQLLHRREGETFGQREREAGMKQKLLIQVRIDPSVDTFDPICLCFKFVNFMYYFMRERTKMPHISNFISCFICQKYK